MDFLSKFIRSKQSTVGKTVKSVEQVNEASHAKVLLKVKRWSFIYFLQFLGRSSSKRFKISSKFKKCLHYAVLCSHCITFWLNCHLTILSISFLVIDIFCFVMWTSDKSQTHRWKPIWISQCRSLSRKKSTVKRLQKVTWNELNGNSISKFFYCFSENHSPRSLSSLAADKSRLIETPQISDSNNTSTPKLAKKQEPSEFDPDISLEISEILHLNNF